MFLRKKIPLFLTRTLFVSSILSTQLFGEMLVVSDPNNDASNATMINHMVTSLKNYEDMIAKAQDQINRLNQISEVLNSTQKFISGSTLKIATPFQLIETLKQNLEGIVASYKRLEKTIQNYDWRDHIKEKRIEGKCPWLRYDIIGTNDLKVFFKQTGEETPLMKDAKELMELLSDDTYSNMSSVVGSLSGRAYAEFFCEMATREQERKRVAENIAKQKRAILDGNFEEQERLRIEGAKLSLQTKLKEEERMRGLWQPLINRNTQMLQTLGVTDKFLNTKDITYCREGKNEDSEEFCYPVLLKTTNLNHRLDKLTQKLTEELTSAGTDTDGQAQAYANFNQEASRLQLEYAKNQAESLNFLNETMSLLSSIMAEDYRRKYQTINQAPVNNKSFNTEEQILESNEKGDLGVIQGKKPEMDKFGFPTLNVGSGGNNNEEEAGL